MNKKLLLAFFICFLLSVSGFGQTTAAVSEPGWEVLVVGGVQNRSLFGKDARRFEFATSAFEILGPASIEWVRDGGWELVAVVADESGTTRLYFKRRYLKSRTDREIAELKRNSLESEQPKSELTDLDGVDEAANIVRRNDANVAMLRERLNKLATSEFAVASVWSNSKDVGISRTAAEIVYDGTSTLLKNGREYRSSEAEKLFAEIVGRIEREGRFDVEKPVGGNTRSISRGMIVPKFGEIYYFAEWTIKLSIFVNVSGRRQIVAQGVLRVKPIPDAK